MPKPLYGKGQKKSAGKAKIDDMGWLTLLAGAPEEQLHLLIVEALSDALAPPNIPHDMKDALAASLIEYASGREIDCDETWITLILELASDFGLDLSEGDEGDTVEAPAMQRKGAEALVGCMKRHRVLCAEPPPPPPLAVGDAVLAVLDEDGDWHDATFVEKLTTAGAPRVVVRFTEWGKLQETTRGSVVPCTEIADDEDAEESEGVCELCGRCLKLTFHHLIPKQTHGRYLGNGLPKGVAEAAHAKGLEAQPSRDFLHRYGVQLCRFCHSTVHRLAPNAVLAERFNTLDVLRAQPEIERFVAFASRQKLTARGTR
jgi:hypothetical protein